ncbi:MAG: serine hydrolase [Methyloceanibacter sp.]
MRRKRWSGGWRAAAILLLAAAASASGTPAIAVDPADFERDLDTGARRLAGLDEAMETLAVPTVSFAVIDKDRIAFARAYGEDATPETLYQAASLSKFAAAVGAMRLLDQDKLLLDQDVNAKLTSWKVPSNGVDQDHPVTLRGLLSMTAGVGVPGWMPIWAQ